ncbi:MAG: hypothetical protein K0Q57_702, partial [Gammaproteobacteria bacterium]|nr:hypothetical protein [Gammaproteobacteria bacterium]
MCPDIHLLISYFLLDLAAGFLAAGFFAALSALGLLDLATLASDLPSAFLVVVALALVTVAFL